MNKPGFTYCRIVPILLLLANCLCTSGQELDYKSQSLFIYNFIKHVTWPEETSKREYVIAVYGSSPIVSELNIIESIKKTVNGKRIIIKEIRTPEEMKDCNLVYIPSSRSRQIRTIACNSPEIPTLIVAERGGLARKGALINFIIMEDNTLKFEVNLVAMKDRSLKISEELLQLGYTVNGRSNCDVY